MDNLTNVDIFSMNIDIGSKLLYARIIHPFVMILGYLPPHLYEVL